MVRVNRITGLPLAIRSTAHAGAAPRRSQLVVTLPVHVVPTWATTLGEIAITQKAAVRVAFGCPFLRYPLPGDGRDDRNRPASRTPILH
jgi:hypothetical protein